MVDKSFIKKKEILYPEPTPVESFDISTSEQVPTHVPTSPEQAPPSEITSEQNVTEQKEVPTFVEQPIEQEIDSAIDTLKKKLLKKKKKVTKIPIIKDEVTLRIEKVMEDGIADAYQELTPIQKQEFKMKGEETAYKIRQLMKKTHVKIKDIFRLLYEWLRMLPGINKFFLEQEAKIKADKIIAIKDVSDIK